MHDLTLTKRFNAAKLLQTDITAWQSCQYKPCQKSQSCLGGPRGTCNRTQGWPICTEEGQERMREAKVKWQRTETYETESRIDRIIRRNNQQIAAHELAQKIKMHTKG